MKMMTGVLLSLLTANTFASVLSTNEIDIYETPMFETKGSETHYQVLMEIFKNANFSVTLEDFRAGKKCMAAHVKQPNDMIELPVAIQSIVIQAAQPAITIPSAGPLFPAQTIPARSAVMSDEKLVIGENAGHFIPKHFAIFQNISAANEFIIYVPKNSVGLFSDVGAEIKVSFRKDKKTDYIPFTVSKTEGNIVTNIYSGYCY